ncbi:uncharacterized protein [Dermacentor andersoni]|uniref:uncharacterized protein isoform X2 n=1 Tax=Dermacentor andersoni TaxID=34620 RepID=UPI0021559FB3|nr:uncharacterized protein LOC126526405 isoform X2 [Dermacentor andersoni]
MATKIVLHAVLLCIVSSGLGISLPYLWSSGQELRAMCKKVVDRSATCDEVVARSETFKKNKGKYRPLLPPQTFGRAVVECVESTLSVADMYKVCDEAETPPEAVEVLEELVSVYENCMISFFNSSMTTTMAPTGGSTKPK